MNLTTLVPEKRWSPQDNMELKRGRNDITEVHAPCRFGTPEQVATWIINHVTTVCGYRWEGRRKQSNKFEQFSNVWPPACEGVVGTSRSTHSVVFCEGMPPGCVWFCTRDAMVLADQGLGQGQSTWTQPSTHVRKNPSLRRGLRFTHPPLGVS